MAQGANRHAKADDKALSDFGKMLKKSLSNIHDATWLGEHSPLATPYLLHDYLKPTSVTARARGDALQKVLHRAYEEMQHDKTSRASASDSGDSSHPIQETGHQNPANTDRRTLYQHLIDEYYFRGRTVDAVKDELGFEKTQFHKHCNAAVEELGRVLITLLNPALRLESPPRTPAHLWEREVAITMCTRELAKGKTVSITGASGVGKTMLGGAVAGFLVHCAARAKRPA
jgi:ABC-type glutathione transport system ATPase component